MDKNVRMKKLKNKQIKQLDFLEIPIRITLIGKSMVGKSCLTYRFINYNIPKSHAPTVEDRFISIIKIHENKYNIEILDTGGDEEYQNSLDFWISFVEGFLLVFAINDEKSFNTLKYKRDKIILFKNV